MSRPKGEASSQKTTKKPAEQSGRTKKASSGKATAAARQGRGSNAAKKQPLEAAQPASIPAVPREPLLDYDARQQIAGVVVAVIGAALLVSLLVPTTGVVTAGLNAFLHTLFGIGAVLVPLSLIAWSVTIFTQRVGFVAGRVIVGLLLIALAVMAAFGITTAGCAADTSTLFLVDNLRSRGGYVGNGLAWVLISLFGQAAGIVVIAGIAVAGVIVIGLDLSRAIAALQAHRQQARARSMERRQSRERSAYNRRAADEARDYDVPEDYTPTVLFNPDDSRRAPLSNARQSDTLPSRASTTVIPFDQEKVALDDYAVPPAAVLTRAGMSPSPTTTLLGNEEVRPVDEAYADYAQNATWNQDAHPAAAEEYMPAAPSQQEYPEACGDSRRPAPLERPAVGAGTGLPKPPQAVLKRGGRAASSGWYDPADEWTRDNFDPNDLGTGVADDLVPGVIPGAPLYYDDELEQTAASYAGASAVQSVAVEQVETLQVPASASPSTYRTASPSSSYAYGDVAGAIAQDAFPSFAQDERQAVDAAYEQEEPVELPWDEEPSEPVASKHDESTSVMTSARRVGPTVAEASSRVATTLIDPAPAGAPAAKSSGPYVLPSLSLVQKSGNGGGFVAKKTDGAAKTAAELQSALNEFHVEAEVIDWVEGPTCTTYQVRPGEGVRVSKFTSLEDDIARTLARTSVRIYAPVPGTSYVGIEVSNNVRQNVAFGDVLPCVTGGPLDFAVGLDANGKPVHSDLAKLPHLLIAGTTGSGKSVTVNSIVLSFLMRDTPDDLRLIIVDPKQVEFSEYNGIPHLVMPVVTDPRQAAAALQWGVTEMDRRYRIFSNLGVRDLKAYNNLVANANFDESQTTLTHLPCIVVVIDELADLMMVAKKDVEASIVRIAQLGRAAGIHLIIATQTPRAEIVTGLIRANVANRIALRVSKGTDSRIIIDQGGAEKLLPHGDMLFLEAAYGDRPRRIQGCNVTDEEKSRILSHLKDQPASGKECSMAPLPGAGAQLQLDTSVDVDSERKSSTASPNDDDPLAWEAAKLVVENQLGSTSMIQRRMKLGYARAGRVMDLLEEMGVVGPARGSKPRDVLIADLDELETLRNADASTGE